MLLGPIFLTLLLTADRVPELRQPQGCEYELEYPITFSGEPGTDVWRIETLGEDCAHIIVLLTIRDTSGVVVHTFTLPLDQLNYHGNPRPRSAEEIRTLMQGFDRTDSRSHSGPYPRASALPPLNSERHGPEIERWGAQCPITEHDSYQRARQSDAPLICHALDSEYTGCFWFDPQSAASRLAFYSCYG